MIHTEVIDPMDVGKATFSNYVNTFYHCECLRCEAKETVRKTRIIPEGSQELQNRRADYYGVMRSMKQS